MFSSDNSWKKFGLVRIYIETISVVNEYAALNSKRRCKRRLKKNKIIRRNTYKKK